ncbi:hypothetical protein AAFN60_19135 [Roseibacillus persicicus]|uniref:hypothetical protein n=1 Tax=Roseibacillus persicicus TaxID=454148 RepID=UPI00398A62D3
MRNRGTKNLEFSFVIKPEENFDAILVAEKREGFSSIVAGCNPSGDAKWGYARPVHSISQTNIEWLNQDDRGGRVQGDVLCYIRRKHGKDFVLSKANTKLRTWEGYEQGRRLPYGKLIALLSAIRALESDAKLTSKNL